MQVGLLDPSEVAALRFPLPRDTTSISGMTVATGGKATHTQRGIMEPTKWAEAKAGKRRQFYIWGTFHYSDIFGDQRWVNFCKYGLWDKGTFNWCVEAFGNDASEQHDPK
jgi:hypothetical protein